jgi:hypothetical protein
LQTGSIGIVSSFGRGLHKIIARFWRLLLKDLFSLVHLPDRCPAVTQSCIAKAGERQTRRLPAIKNRPARMISLLFKPADGVVL